MSLSKREIDEAIRLAGLTRDDEIDCDQCLADIAEFTEARVAGRSLSEALLAIEQHLSVCGECREEYEALRAAIEEVGSSE